MPEDTSGDAWEAATDDVRASVQPSDGARPSGSADKAEPSGSADKAEPSGSADKAEPSGSADGANQSGSADGGAKGETPTAHESTAQKKPAEENPAEEKGTAKNGTTESEVPEGAAGSAEYTDVRQVLDAVAAGRLSPEEAAPLLDRLQKPTESAGAQAGAEKPKAERPVDGPIKPRRLRVRAIGRRVKIVGEPFVNTVAVDGPHVIRQDGDTLQVTSEGEFGASLDGFTLTPPRSLRDVQQKFLDFGRELSVRVNPSLEVEVEVTAGSINAERAPLLEEVRVTAGSARVRDVEGPIDVLVQAGSAQVEGRIAKGRSRLRVESGSLQLRLLQGSSVRIRPDTQLGRVQWDPPRPGKDSDERVVGSGDARLDLEVVMGAATVKEAP